ncbi:MAG: quinolinate synthase NadA, partial [Actinomycetota bacterium]
MSATSTDGGTATGVELLPSDWREQVRQLADERDAVILAHNYQVPEIQDIAHHTGDSLGLSRVAAQVEASTIVFCGVHFMAESVALLAGPEQAVWITNPKAGCTMEMLAKDHLVQPIADQLLARYGDDLLVVAYMNTSGRIKALAGRTGGAVCTSSNADKVVRWARKQNKKIFFVPDQHLG